MGVVEIATEGVEGGRAVGWGGRERVYRRVASLRLRGS